MQRDRLLENLLLNTACIDSEAIEECFVDEITIFNALNSADSEHNIVFKDDILRFNLSPLRCELGTAAHARLEKELDKIIESIAEFMHADLDWQSLDEEERHRVMWSLPESIASLKNSIESTRSEADMLYHHLEELIDLISQAHSRLESGLSSLITKHSPMIDSRRIASDELLATRIEASLIKLSLIRARATQALYYGHQSTTNPDVTVADALSSSYAKLKAEDKKMREEEAALDRQLGEYEVMLKLVDGGNGGYKQIVEDWTRVQREREECIRDLRRLGWTGD
ncbi:hypothetical protein H0H93_010959 [Arthromyces matolae]|nr:hypothetical protein H0H93_010959 [Arthromyces matolae]